MEHTMDNVTFTSVGDARRWFVRMWSALNEAPPTDEQTETWLARYVVIREREGQPLNDDVTVDPTHYATAGDRVDFDDGSECESPDARVWYAHAENLEVTARALRAMGRADLATGLPEAAKVMRARAAGTEDAERYRTLKPYLYVDGDRGAPDGPLVEQYVTAGFLSVPLTFSGDDVDAAIDAARAAQAARQMPNA
jgi:hypothetical protein